MEPLRQAYKRRMELIDRVCDVCASGGLTSEALEQFAPESRLIESEIRLDKASSSQFDAAAQDWATCRAYPASDPNPRIEKLGANHPRCDDFLVRLRE
jgi:hypothetical protein